MKKLRFNLIAALAAFVMMLTSCMSESDVIDQAWAFGVVDYKGHFYQSEYVDYPIAHADFLKVNMGGYSTPIYAYTDVNLSTEVNQEESLKERKYYTASNVRYYEMDYTPYVNDLTYDPKEAEAMENELKIKGISLDYSRTCYTHNYLFFIPVFEKLYEDQRNEYTIQLDSENVSQHTFNGKSYNMYDLYVRVSGYYNESAKESSKSLDILAANFSNHSWTTIYTEAKSSDKDYIFIRINYVESINSSTGAITWARFEPLPVMAFKTDK